MPTNRLYYRLKPLLPWRLRLALRRIVARRAWEANPKTWPINEAAGQRPKDWPGWPEGNKFAFVLTHDVEGSKGYDKCRKLMQIETECGFRSSFNFIPEGDYQVNMPFCEELKGKGFEVGVHDLRHDGKLYQTRDEFSANAARINRYLKAWGASGFRSGFMLHNLEWLKELNVLYDASTFDTDPFEPQPDAANTIFPFWVAAANESGYVELPYTLVQDSTLFLYLQQSSIDIWKQKLDWIAAHGGMALMIVHPDYMNFGDGPCAAREFPAALYREFLEYVRNRYEGQYWAVLPKTLAQWYATSVVRRPAAA